MSSESRSLFPTRRELTIGVFCSAGQAVVFHSTANKESKTESRLPKPMADALASFSNTYQESDNPFVVMSRSVTGTIGRWFDETETAKVTKWVKEMDPTFTQESFLKELREYIVPELVDAYVNGDQPTLKQWCSEAVSPLLSSLSSLCADSLLRS